MILIEGMIVTTLKFVARHLDAGLYQLLLLGYAVSG